jgi:hypothetical protein
MYLMPCLLGATFMSPETTISLIQLICTIFGGLFALFLFWQSNREKRQSFVATLYDKLYNDAEIRALLYALDKEKGLEEIKPNKALEQAADKTLRFLDFVGGLLKNGTLRPRDIASFRYEVNLVSLGPLQEYITHLRENGVHLDNIDYVTGGKQPSRAVRLLSRF